METEEAKERVLQRLESDLTSADLQWSLFIAALESYRHDSILRPFPSAYVVGDGNKNFQGLVSVGHLKNLSSAVLYILELDIPFSPNSLSTPPLHTSPLPKSIFAFSTFDDCIE